MYVGGLDEKVTEAILWELFLQAGPVGMSLVSVWVCLRMSLVSVWVCMSLVSVCLCMSLVIVCLCMSLVSIWVFSEYRIHKFYCL